jgi:pimeloyl-ACP methyl ester carboxylesterase
VKARAKWRHPALGKRGELDLPQGRLRYFEAGSGPPIVFVHGYFVNANLWRKIIPTLAPDFHCVALDLPFGSHSLPMKSDADLSETGIVNLIVDAIEALGLDQVTLVGMDTGGAICQFIVTQRPQRIGRLVLCSCDYRDNFPPRRFTYLKLFPVISPRGATWLAPLLLAPLRLRAVRRLPTSFGALTKRQVDRKVEDTWVLPGLEDAGVRDDVNKAIRIFDKKRANEAADKLGGFERPALIAWSREDKVFPTEHGTRLAMELPNARLELIEGARTFSMEDQPERLSELIAGFVREPQPAALRQS